MEVFNKKQQMVGKLKGVVYVTYRKPEHFMRKFQGFGISIDILDLLHENGCQMIKMIYDDGSGYVKVYQCPISYYLYSLKGWLDGDDKQLFVSVEDMEEYVNQMCRELR